MRRELFAGAVLATLIGGAAGAQNDTGNYRRFTDDVGDTNRSNRIIYAPIGSAYPERRPARQPYDEASAAWYLQPVGATAVKPSKVLDKAEYTLDRFDLTPGGMRVVITRTGGQPEPAPMLQILNTETQISSRATPVVTPVAGGSRYTFLVRPPHQGLASAFQTAKSDRFELRFMSSREVPTPPSIARRPTFGGESKAIQALNGPPRLPRAERVAGKRIEYRSASSPGVVVQDRVAGSRQERRNRR